MKAFDCKKIMHFIYKSLFPFCCVLLIFSSVNVYAEWWPNAQVGIGPYLDIGGGYNYMNHPGGWFEYRDESGDTEIIKLGDEKVTGYKQDAPIKSRGGGSSIGGGITFIASAAFGIKNVNLGYNYFKGVTSTSTFRMNFVGIGLCADMHYIYSNFGNMVSARYGLQMMAPMLPAIWMKFYMGRAIVSDSMEFVDYYEKDEETSTLKANTFKTKNGIWSFDGRMVFPSLAAYFIVNRKDYVMIEGGFSELSHEDDESGFYARGSVKVGYIYNFIFME